MSQRRATRLKDIAEAANVSVAAVSRILRSQNLAEFSSATQERVHKVARELGWRPNLLVQGLQTGQTGTLGLFIAPFDTYWTGVLYGIHDTLLAANRVPIVLWPHALVHPTVNADPPGLNSSEPRLGIGHSPLPGLADGEQGRGEYTRLLRLIDRRVDAIITWPLFESEAIETLAGFARRGWPIVTLDFALPDDAPAVTITNHEDQAMGLVFNHLFGLGKHEVAYLGLNREHLWASRRQRSFSKMLKQHGSDPGPERMWQVDTAGDHDRVHIIEKLRAHPEVTSVVAANDHLALQVIEAAHELGREVPQHLSVIGYGNKAFDTTTTPLTTIEQNPYEFGAAAARFALEGSIESAKIHEVSPSELVIRNSTAAPYR